MAGQDSIRLIDVSKTYGPVSVLGGVNLELRRGEVHALLGANGAGKSTLLGCLSGAVVPTSGTIRIGEETYTGFTPRKALDAGVSIIYQHFQLAPSLSVSDNVFLGDEQRTAFGLLDRKLQRSVAAQVLGDIDVDIDPAEIVENLSVGEQQCVEIARSMRRKPRLLILDEPTAALGKHEVVALLKLVKQLAHELGVAIVYVTHLLGEVMEVADRVSILRGGTILWTRPRSEVAITDLIAAISPDALASDPEQKSASLSKQIVGEFEGFRSAYCGPLDLALREGEIIGIYGMLGSGRTDLLETIAGARGGWRGSFRWSQKPVHQRSIAESMDAGVALVASDRIVQSLFGSLSAQDNLLMPHYAVQARPLRRRKVELDAFVRIAAAVRLSPPYPEADGSSFSGGNAQKLMLARWLVEIRDIKLLLLDEPTQGVDVGSRAQIYGLIRRFAREAPGRAVLFASSDPEEVLSLADRIVILESGRVSHVVDTTIDESQLIALAQSMEMRHAHDIPTAHGA
jgi:ribose transport system ATP-binding protein